MEHADVQEQPPNSAEMPELENPLDYEIASHMQNATPAEDEVTGPRRFQVPVWERVQQLGNQLKMRLPNNNQYEEMNNEELLNTCIYQMNDMASTITSMKQELTDFKSDAERLIKKSVLGVDLDDHGMTIPTCLPSAGANYPSLCDPAKLKLIDFHFPPKSRFSGGRNCMPVRAFLDNLTRAQKICQLRFNEFCHIILTRCNPPALDIIQTAIDNKDDVKTIYVSFINAFDREKEPHMWQNMLFGYRVPLHHNMEKIVAEVGKMATKASFQFNTIESRKMYTDQTGLEVLKQVLPFNVLRHVQDTILKLRLQKDRLPTYNEVASNLKLIADTLDAELMAAPSTFKFGPPRDFMVFEKPRSYTDSRQPRYHPKVNAITQVHTNNEDTAHQHGTTPKQAQEALRNYKPNNNNKNRIYNSQQSDKKQQRGNQYQPNRNQQNTNTSTRFTTGKKYCVLCTGNNHDASDSCYSIRNDVGKQAIVSPAYGHCENCHKLLEQKLFHPEAFCPLREALMKLYREKKIRPYGIFADYIRKHPELGIEIRPAPRNYSTNNRNNTTSSR